jgi:hypothetical protein
VGEELLRELYVYKPHTIGLGMHHHGEELLFEAETSHCGNNRSHQHIPDAPTQFVKMFPEGQRN